MTLCIQVLAEADAAVAAAQGTSVLGGVGGGASSSSNQCQCHACLQQAGSNISTSLPTSLPTAPRPAALHLYPHIHGANNLAGMLHSLLPTDKILKKLKREKRKLP